MIKVKDVKPAVNITVTRPSGRPIDYTEENPEGSSHMRKPRVGDVKSKVKIKSRKPTAEEAEDFTGKLRENWEHQQPNPDQVLDDTQRGDIDPRERGVIVTRVRSIDDYTIERRNPYGFWYIVGLDHDLGTFTGLKQAQDALLRYLKNAQS